MKLKTLAMLTALLLPIPTAASAHDELVDQSPQSGQVLEAGVIEIELTFSSDLLALAGGSGSEIIVLDSDGTPMNNGCSVVSANVALAKADIDQPGKYQVGWRAVSSDGHPISGTFEFEVVNTAGYVANPDYVFVECESSFDPNLIATNEQPVFIYWLLWGSMGLVALALVVFLRPKRNIQNRKPSED